MKKIVFITLMSTFALVSCEVGVTAEETLNIDSSLTIIPTTDSVRVDSVHVEVDSLKK